MIPHNAFQNAAVKQASRSCKTTFGIPKNLTQFLKNNYATSGTVNFPYPALQGTKCNSLPNLSTMTIRALKPLTSDNKTMKSIVQYSNYFGRNWQRLKQALRLLVNILSALANLAPSNKLLPIDSKIRPPYKLKKSRCSLSYTQMCCTTRIMQQFW